MKSTEFLTESIPQEPPDGVNISQLFYQFYVEPSPEKRKNLLSMIKYSNKYWTDDLRKNFIEWRDGFIKGTPDTVYNPWFTMAIGIGCPKFNMKVAVGANYARLKKLHDVAKKADRIRANAAHKEWQARLTAAVNRGREQEENPLKPLFDAVQYWYEGSTSKADVTLILNHPLAKQFKSNGKGYATLYRAIPVPDGYLNTSHEPPLKLLRPITRKARYPIVAFSADPELAREAAEDFESSQEVIVFAKKIKASDIVLDFDTFVGHLEAEEGFEEPSNGDWRAEDEYWVTALPEYLTFSPEEQYFKKKKKK